MHSARSPFWPHPWEKDVAPDSRPCHHTSYTRLSQQLQKKQERAMRTCAHGIGSRKKRMEHTAVVIIGGGILGLATAYRLTQQYPERRVVVLEKEAGLA